MSLISLAERYKVACDFKQPIDDALVASYLKKHLELCGYKGELNVVRLIDWASSASSANAAWDAMAEMAANVAWTAWAARAARAGRAAWAARASRAAGDARDAWASRAAGDARDAWAASAPQAARAGRAAWDASWVSLVVIGAEEIGDTDTKNVWMPVLNALESGCWLYWIDESSISWIPVPIIRHQNGSPHCVDGPAYVSLDVEEFFYRGVRVPRHVIESPQTITLSEIESSDNTEVRRVLIERFGQPRYIKESGAKEIDKINLDDMRVPFGVRGARLYRKEVVNDEPIVMVAMRNSTPEPTGEIKNYMIRVPPDVTNCVQAIAWINYKTESEYAPAIET